MYIDGTLEHPHPKLGWVHNDNLRWIPEVDYASR